MKKIVRAVCAIAVMSLILTVSCSKKDEGRNAGGQVQQFSEHQPEAPAPEPEHAPPDTPAAGVQAEPADVPVEKAAPAPAPAATPAPAPAAGRNVVIEYISGPKQADAGQEIALNCSVNGAGAASAYVWRFKNGSDVIERKTSEPQVKVALNKAGEYAITCDVVESGKSLASQQFKVRILNSGRPINSAAASSSDTASARAPGAPLTANAGPNALSSPNREVRLNGTGSSQGGAIVKYEWDFDGDGVFDWNSGKTGTTAYTFKTNSSPVFRVTDAAGNTALDTVRVTLCPAGMVVAEGGKSCVDEFEWPNRRGAAPAENISPQEASALCEGAGKRLCASGEWQGAAGFKCCK